VDRETEADFAEDKKIEIGFIAAQCAINAGFDSNITFLRRCT
jgi:hypothetical protein